MFANELVGRPGTVVRAAGLLLVVGPPVSVFYLGTDAGTLGTEEQREFCGSVLSAALTRPEPGFPLEPFRRDCLDTGRRAVVLATAYGFATTAVAVGLVAHATLPVWRRQRAAA